MNLPNGLTIFRILLVPFIVLCYYFGGPNWNIYVAILFIIASLTDMVDGYLARKWKQVTTFGKLMDPMADKILFMAALLIVVEWGKLSTWVAIILLAREFIVSGFRLVVAEKGIVMAAGAIGKWKTATQLVGITFILLENFGFRKIGIPFGEILVYISVALSVWSCIEYIYANRTIIKG